MRGRSRIFMVGIGSAPNIFLMTRAAELGRGTFTHIGSAEQVEERMRTLFGKLESPVVTNLTATFSAAGVGCDAGGAARSLSRRAGRRSPPRSARSTGTLEVKGMIGDRPWVVTLPLANAAEGRGLSKLWARRKIADAEVARTLRQITPDEADRRILALALEHHLVTRLTSLVAVDRTPSRPDGAHLTRAEIPLNLPAGWDFDKVFGRRARRRRRVPAERRADAEPAEPGAARCLRRGDGVASPKPVARRSRSPSQRRAERRDRCRRRRPMRSCACGSGCCSGAEPDALVAAGVDPAPRRR